MTTKSTLRENRFGRFALLSRRRPLRVRPFVAVAALAFAFGLGLAAQADAAPPSRPRPSRLARPVESTPPGAPIAPNSATRSHLPFA